GPVDAAAQREDLGAGAVLRAELPVAFRAMLEDVGHVGQRLDVVDHGRLAVQTDVRRERRADARLAALALQRLEQRGFLAADVSTRAAVGVDLAAPARAEDVLPDEAFLPRLLDLAVEV